MDEKKPGLLASLLLKTVFRSRPGPALTDGAGWQSVVGYSSASGKHVTIDAALQIATVWSCVRLIAETIATLPLLVYKRNANGDREVARSHPLYELLHDAPHADYTAVEFWEGIVLSLLLQGNAYAEKLKIGGRLVALRPLSGDLITVERNRQGARVYRYSGDGGVKTFSEDQIWHIRGFGNGGDLGLSTIGYARNSMGGVISTEESSAKVFSNGLQVAGVLTSDQTLKPEQRAALQAILGQYMGSANSQKTMVLESGLKYQQVTMKPDDAQMLQTRSFNVEEICRWFRVPPSMIGHTVKSTSWGTGIEQQMIGFLQFTLRPYLNRIEQSIRRSLIAPEQRKTIFAEFKVEGLLRADSSARAAYYATMVQNGIMTRNEVRGLENLPSDPDGDKLTVQSQNVPLGQAAAPPALAPPANDDEEEAA